MNVIKTSIDGLLVFEPRVFGDHRGFFLETWHRDRYREYGVDAEFVQDNTSRSMRGVLRGLHFQIRHPQGKLVYVIRGEVFDVAVDLRQGSPTFGQWHGEILNCETHRQMYVPPGMAHGFLVLSEWVDFAYKCTDFYRQEDEGGLLWNDPGIGIKWPLPDPMVNARDAANPRLAEQSPDRLPQVRYERAPA